MGYGSLGLLTTKPTQLFFALLYCSKLLCDDLSNSRVRVRVRVKVV